MKKVTVIGAGLAGCEAALQLVSKGIFVDLYEAKPNTLLPAYNLGTYAELVCNNSLGGISTDKPLGLLLSELKLFGSKLIEIAEDCRLLDPNFFSVDKQAFSKKVTKVLIESGVNIINDQLVKLPREGTIVLASGPLTNEELIFQLAERYGIDGYHFSDASSAIVDIKSIDLSNENIKKLTDDLYAIFIPHEVFDKFCDGLAATKPYRAHNVDLDADFEKCQTIENLARISSDALYRARFYCEHDDRACLLLRRENGLHDGFIMTGCMTCLKHSDQKRLFSLLPGFCNCKIIKYGRMHRNTYFDAPRILDCFYRVKGSNLYLIGQISGTDGYAPAIASGLVSAWSIIYGETLPPFPKSSMIGALASYISNPQIVDYQPMCAEFSLIDCDSTEDFKEKSHKAIMEYKQMMMK